MKIEIRIETQLLPQPPESDYRHPGIVDQQMDIKKNGYIYIYIYIYREREREREKYLALCKARVLTERKICISLNRIF